MVAPRRMSLSVTPGPLAFGSQLAEAPLAVDVVAPAPHAAVTRATLTAPAAKIVRLLRPEVRGILGPFHDVIKTVLRSDGQCDRDPAREVERRPAGVGRFGRRHV